MGTSLTLQQELFPGLFNGGYFPKIPSWPAIWSVTSLPFTNLETYPQT